MGQIALHIHNDICSLLNWKLAKQTINEIFFIRHVVGTSGGGIVSASAALRCRWWSQRNAAAATVVILAFICDQRRQRRLNFILRASPPPAAASSTSSSGLLAVLRADVQQRDARRLQFGVDDDVEREAETSPPHHFHRGATGEVGGHFPSDSLPRRPPTRTAGAHRRPRR